jgi:hypothetical protein
LGKDSSKWTKVHALSRSQKDSYPKHVEHDSIDLTGDANKMAEQLKGVEGEYLFFAAYLQKDSEQENWDVNGAMLDNFLRALDTTGASKKLKRVILVTGAKQYGLHLGRPKNPMFESDPRIEGPGRPPNFYYNQQDILKKHASSRGYDWVVTYPNDVIGFAKNNFMNLSTSLGLYAAVSKELNGELVWPGNSTFYHAGTSFTSSKLHADFCQWAALEPRCSNQAFNVVNGDTESYENLWPKLAARFGCTVPKDQLVRDLGANSSSQQPLAETPPIADFADTLGLVGSEAVKQTLLEARLDVTKWAARDDVKAAWGRLAERHGLEKDAFEKATWAFLLFVLGRPFNILISMSKAREYGYTGYKDTWKALEEVFEELEQEKYLPPTSSGNKS